MNTVLLVTHEGIGSTLQIAATNTLKTLPCEIISIDCPQDADLDALLESALGALQGAGKDVLIFSDLYGASPHNLAQQIKTALGEKAHLISGLNLPMLLRTLNYIDLPLADLCKKAIEGGVKGICE